MEYESTSLYRTLRQEDGIMRNSTAIDNLYQWFGSENPKPPAPELGDSCLFYQNLGLGNDDRLILILSTPRQREMAWAYGHQKQMLLDGTFGVCSTCVLVFFLMAIDDRNVGIPVATIIFTPKKDAKLAMPLMMVLCFHVFYNIGRMEWGQIQRVNTSRLRLPILTMIHGNGMAYKLFGATFSLCCVCFIRGNHGGMG